MFQREKSRYIFTICFFGVLVKFYSAEKFGNHPATIFDAQRMCLEDGIEGPQRYDALFEGASRVLNDLELVQDRVSTASLARIHSPQLLDFYRAMEKNGFNPPLPDSFPPPGISIEPENLLARYGRHCTDTQSPLTREYYTEALRSAYAAELAAKEIDSGDAYVLCRPPGHHAGRDFFGGFCFLNNAALAAEILSKKGSVAVLDVDFHHGNGTQDIFYKRKDVAVFSLHGDPAWSYPYFQGYESEKGSGEGTGYNFNYPLEETISKQEYFSVLEQALKDVADFNPKYLIVSFGADTYKEDPVGGLSLDVQDFSQLGSMLGALQLPSLIIQEGGYAVSMLPDIVENFLQGFLKK
jgi:acetoin utilization deacetylase AcuC-like enzyme